MPETQPLQEQLIDEIGTHVEALMALVGPSEEMMAVRRRVEAMAPVWARVLMSDDDRTSAQLVIDVMNLLWPGDTSPSTHWWGTALGRAVARSVGHPSVDVVSYSVAAAMLGVTKQYVYKLTRQGKLDTGPDGGVTVTSVRQRLRAAAADL